MNLFGGLELPPDRSYPNYDTFFNAFVSTFNVLNLENWNMQMYAVMSVQHAASCVYFLLWIVAGKYTLLSLFLAVSGTEGFAS
jgi:hypothetical protein